MDIIKISIDTLIKGIGVLSFILILLSVHIVIKSSKEKAEAGKIKAYIQNKQDLWYQYFNDEIVLPVELIPNNDIEIKATEEIFLAYIKNISNSTIEEKIRKFSNQYLRQYYSGFLLSRKWSLRMNALYRIIDFKIDSLAPECKKLEKRTKLSPEEHFQLMIIYSMFNETDFIKEFANLSVRLSEYEYKKLLVGFKSEILEHLMHQMKELPMIYRHYFIDILGIRRELGFLPFLEKNLSHNNTEIRIRSLKAINEIGIVSNLDKYKPFLKASQWEERLMLAKILGAFPLEQVYTYLEELLQDENWWVRSQAAQTIGKSKDGKSRLKTFIATAQDQYAIDMAREVLGGEY
ncbi:MAG TPA: HEAT repeat domain-containing protein [Mogibacterium sp.]|nr:HEAT repeat domain-containing protein [Mogibacterium sp.]